MRPIIGGVQYLFHIAPGATEAVEVDPGRLDEARAAGGWVWLDVTEFADDDVHQVGREFSFDPLAVHDIFDWSQHPKVEDHVGYTFVVGHGLSMLSADRLRTTEYDAFVADDFLVTFHQEDLPGFLWGREHVIAPGAMAESAPDLLWARLAEAGSSRFQPLADGLEERIDDLEERALAANPSVPAEVLALRRDVQTLRQVVIAQRDAYRVLARGDLPGISPRGARRLSHVFDDFNRLAEVLEGARLLLGSVLETYRSTVAERANEVMKVLTVFSAIILPLSLVAGIYGMNFHNMPELQTRWGYFTVVSVMVVVAVALWLYFARRGFVGGPKLHRVPKVVGRGLVDLVKVTTKPAVMLLHLASRPNDETHD
jgi:magnesium transporter